MTLQLDISKVRSVPGAKERYHFSEEKFDFAASWRLAEPLVVDLALENTGGELHLTGKAHTVVKNRCDRCLAPVVISAECEIDERLLYQNDAAQFSHLAPGELEEKYYLYDGDLFEAGDIVRENLLDELPLKVLCREDCQGLCLKCGKNLNEGPCACEKEEIDPRLAILAKLKSD